MLSLVNPLQGRHIERKRTIDKPDILSLRAQRRNLPGGWLSVKYILFAHPVGFFTIVQNDV